ncbi:MAG: TorF family putative porin [Nevskiales bacterium]
MKHAKLLAAVLVLFSAPALAQVSGNITAISEYMFRGVAQEGGAALQGSLDYSREDGWYSGVWGSNCSECGGNEIDFYGGWTGEVGRGVTLDAGVVYYLFTEDAEVSGAPDIDYPEIYLGAGYDGLSGTLYYSNKLVDELSDIPGSDQTGFYFTADYTHALREGLELVLQVGRSWGDGVDAVLGDAYTDYSVTVVKTLDDGFSLSAAVIDTDLDADATATTPAREDDPKFVVGLSKDFAF